MDLQTLHISDWLASSWDRSREAGLKEIKKPSDAMLTGAVMQQRRFDAQHVINAVEECALPLFNQVFARSDSRLILTDAEGVVVASWGQQRFRDKLTTISLSSGACWQERIKGTNAIGTALHDQRAVTIVGNQHYIKHHRFISCSASPLFNHKAELVGVLDVTSEQTEHDVMAQLLVQNMVQLVENRLLSQIPEGVLQIDLAMDKSVLTSGWQGIIIANESGQVVAHNQLASQLMSSPSLIGASVDELLEESKKGPSFVYEQRALKHKNPRSKLVSASSDLHFGDHQIETAWQQANRVLGKDISLLILGETGVGKGEFVKALHKNSNRRKETLVTVNCGALPKDLIESELFGHAAGAFTGASAKGYLGRIRQADKGILFLDEIGEMPLEAQCRLLSVLQDKVVVPVGSTESHQVDIQIIAATHQDLEKLVSQGHFRQDLYYRLNGLIVHLPPLRTRQDKQEIIHAIYHKYSGSQKKLSSSLLALLSNYYWPGNLRELDNLLKVSCLMGGDGEELQLEHIPTHLTKLLVDKKDNTEGGLETADLQSAVNNTLIDVYNAHNGNISKVSRILGVSRNTIYRKLKKLGMLK
ncbi:sigma-54-dependent Fis family transcriptional regulator [Vibrio japonicus]|uniref:Sigma-54-dependent Fis family transcriptional regulator n=1 Tax=Vibrio japonicus TaxID=1824638 RepID=A0ABY5LP99_9VIBR|nr:sigma-54-dependent Fis family transcriptional regulator [Vibrio japonicus]UUM32907.1 sigma-54-dependent Fis family transcriptional regulator [Vibrio japonicus]